MKTLTVWFSKEHNENIIDGFLAADERYSIKDAETLKKMLSEEFDKDDEEYTEEEYTEKYEKLGGIVMEKFDADFENLHEGETTDIVNKATGETIVRILTNHSMTLDDAIKLMGEVIESDDERFDEDGENIVLNGNRYYYDDLDLR